ncbi:hypothetical protein B0H10DRAFT_1940968 [Mycena sp. CBHHK59/15]|nr:hypothetical protein B0H10DRAFT_1940968 [Mycena sp. CBHHK59/15]
MAKHVPAHSRSSRHPLRLFAVLLPTGVEYRHLCILPEFGNAVCECPRYIPSNVRKLVPTPFLSPTPPLQALMHTILQSASLGTTASLPLTANGPCSMSQQQSLCCCLFKISITLSHLFIFHVWSLIHSQLFVQVHTVFLTAQGFAPLQGTNSRYIRRFFWVT